MITDINTKENIIKMLDNYIDDMFSNIDESWFDMIYSNNNLLRKIFKTINTDFKNQKIENNVDIEKYIAPHPNNIFRAFTYFPVDDLQIVLIGQDPYPEYKKANGLCFSYSREHVPTRKDSMTSILKCVKNTCNIDISCNDLESWHENKMLLMNMYLTRYSEKMISNGLPKLSKFWKQFTIQMLESMSKYNNYSNDKIYFLLWGGESQKLEKYLTNSKFIILKWCHPSPISKFNMISDSPNNFINCDHFKILQSEYNFRFTKIVKDMYIFTDGGCINNGKKNARASCAFYIPNEFDNDINYKREITFARKIKPNEYNYNKLKNVLEITEKVVPPSNARAEYMAVIYVLMFIIDNKLSNQSINIIIVSDSTYVINQFTAKHNANANCDLRKIMDTLKNIINKKINILHQRAHVRNKSGKVKSGMKKYNVNTSYNQDLIKNNEIADSLCSDLL